MKSLLNGCAAVALFVGLASQAHAQVEVRDAPVHAIPAEATPDPSGAEPKAEPAVVKALMEQKAAPAPQALTPEENAFFAVLGQRVTDAASAYESYVRRATAMDARFGDAAAVQKAVRAGAAYQPQQLQEGIVAYAALLALRNDAFVDGVKNMRDPSFADRLTASPQAVLGVRGADEAAADVAAALRAQGAALLASGKTITQAAYDVQGQSWSKTPVLDPKGVLAEAKEAGAQPRAASVPAKERLLESLVAPAQQASVAPTPVALTPTGAPDVVRGLALAALAIMGRTGDDKEASFEALLHDASSVDCLKMAKLNLNQCLAVAGPHYEDVYCTGRHAVSDTAQCVSAAANGAGGVLPAPAPAFAPPLQRADSYGPEQARAYGQPGLKPQDQDDDDTPPPAAPRYAVAQPTSYAEAPQTYAPPARAPAPPQAYADGPQAYAQNDPAYQDPRGYAPQQPPAQPAPQYQQQPYTQQPYPPAPTYPAQQYPAPQQAYQSQGQPYPQSQYPYGYAARSYYGQ